MHRRLDKVTVTGTDPKLKVKWWKWIVCTRVSHQGGNKGACRNKPCCNDKEVHSPFTGWTCKEYKQQTLKVLCPFL